jgi:hypothetical protein
MILLMIIELKNNIMDLIQESENKGFLSRDKLIKYNKTYFYLWMCELQKWLRDKHNLHIAIEFTYSGYIISKMEKFTENDTFISSFPLRENDRLVYFKTYELALERGLQELLNLIN